MAPYPSQARRAPVLVRCQLSAKRLAGMAGTAPSSIAARLNSRPLFFASINRHNFAPPTVRDRTVEAKGSIEFTIVPLKTEGGAIDGMVAVMRMATIECKSDCEFLELTETRAKEIYYQNPAFAYAVLQVIISRLMEDISLQKEASLP